MGWTEPQEKAIEKKGNILVSAAAGSGKTAVLVERVIKKITDKNGISADRLLIVTFTNAAAAEMQGRIASRLDEECLAHPEDLHLLEQKRLLASAKICTIDSFCIDLVRENFEKLEIAPDFKIGEKGSLKAIDERIISEIINRNLEEDNEDFASLLDIIGAEFDEKDFKELIFKMYNFSRQFPFPDLWYDSIAEAYKSGAFEEDGLWYNYVFDEAKKLLDEALGLSINIINLSLVNPKCAEKWNAFFVRASEQIASLLKAQKQRNWSTFYKALQEYELLPLPTVQKVGDIPEIAAVKDGYKYLRESLYERLSKLFYADYDYINSQFASLKAPVLKLVEILREFDQKLFEAYKEENVFTFHNTEHLALKLLCERRGNEIIPNEEAKAITDNFDEVMVDEYQDTNDLQEILFKILSKNERNLFVVGDIKQSIYGFRGANPKNFAKKKENYLPIESANENEARKIILGENFRCKDTVCDFINFFFERFMTKQTGDIDYSDGEQLKAAAKYPSCDFSAVEAHIIDCKTAEEKVAVCEAKYIGEYILKVMKTENCIRDERNKDIDNPTLRNPKFSDFNILMRSPKSKAPIMVEEFKKMGIPVSYNPESFAESMEIMVILNLLKIIDNPENDIALMSVLISPLFRFTANEVATIRAGRKYSSLYSAVIHAAESGNEKALKFLKTLEKFRTYAVTNPISRLIFALITETGYMNTVSIMSEGKKRRGNLLLLCKYAEQYAETGNDSIGGFVKHILKLSDEGLAAAASESGDMVKIMSIHASKGLQFPICIVADTATRFGEHEKRGSTVYSADMGIGFKYYNSDIMEKETTLGREIVLDKLHNDRICEELRLLYVAMTRTKDRLVITSALSNRDKKVSDLRNLLIANQSEISNGVLRRTSSYSDWLLLSLMLHPCGKALRGNDAPIIAEEAKSTVEVVLATATEDTSGAVAETVKGEPNVALSRQLKENILGSYPYEAVSRVEAKASVSVIANKAESRKFRFSGKPSFMSKGGITAAEKGTATHKVMELFDFTKANDIDGELERLYEYQYISEREYKAIEREKLKAFFSSDIFARIMNAEDYKRELRFLTEMPASRVAPELKGEDAKENILVQGAVDLCIVESDGIVILDFKTDRAETVEDLKTAYGEQLNIYGMACEKIFEKPVKEKIIYSFALSEAIKL